MAPVDADPSHDAADAWRRRLACSPSRWCSPGSHLATFAPPTALLPVPASFVAYVLADGLFLPDASEAVRGGVGANSPSWGRQLVGHQEGHGAPTLARSRACLLRAAPAL